MHIRITETSATLHSFSSVTTSVAMERTVAGRRVRCKTPFMGLRSRRSSGKAADPAFALGGLFISSDLSEWSSRFLRTEHRLVREKSPGKGDLIHGAGRRPAVQAGCRR